MSNYIDVNVRCPFFNQEDKRAQKIRCEGLTDDSSITLQYKAFGSWQTQIRVFCCGRYENCEIYRAIIDAKYRE